VVAKGGIGREVERFNPTFAQVMLELGVGAEMCAPRSGNQKATVEHLVKWVKNTFFKWRKFADERDLEAQLAVWVREVNFETSSRATGKIPETLRQEELPRLRAVRLAPETLALRVPIFVGPTAEVMFEGRAYTMPPRAANVAGTAFVHERSPRREGAALRETTAASQPRRASLEAHDRARPSRWMREDSRPK
jgi:hypothetical protein